MSQPAQTFRIPAGQESPAIRARIDRFLARLPPDRAYVVSVSEYRPRRSNEQNALLWVLYEQILAKGGEALGGWTREDCHEFFLGEHFGWVTHEGFGQRRKKPARRSSGLNKQDFTDLIEFVVRYMAERGTVLDLPGDE